MSKLKLGSIADEAAACRKAWAAHPKAILAWHCHHEILIEKLTEPAENRIAYILRDKPEHEQALRLHLFRPFRGPLPAQLKKATAEWHKADAEWHKADAEWHKATAEWHKAGAVIAHKKQCKNCPWDGKTIFAWEIR